MLLGLKSDQNDFAKQIANLDAHVRGDVKSILSEHSRELTEVSRSLESLERMLRGNEERGGMVARMERMEERLGMVSGDLRGAMDEFKKALESRNIEETKGRFSLTNTVVAGLLTIISAVLIYLLTQAVKKGGP